MPFATRVTDLRAPGSCRVRVLAQTVVLLAILLAGRALPAQQNRPVLQNQAPQQDDQSVTTIKKDVNVVNVLATVRNKDGKIVSAPSTKKTSSSKSTANRKRFVTFLASPTRPSPSDCWSIPAIASAGCSKKSAPPATSSSTTCSTRPRTRPSSSTSISTSSYCRTLRARVPSWRRHCRSWKCRQPNRRRPAVTRRGPVRGGGTKLYDAIFLASDEITTKVQWPQGDHHPLRRRRSGQQGWHDRAIESAQRANTLVYTILFADKDGYNNNGGRKSWRPRSPRRWLIPAEATPAEVIPAAVAKVAAIPAAAIRAEVIPVVAVVAVAVVDSRGGGGGSSHADGKQVMICSPSRPADVFSRSRRKNPSTTFTRQSARNFATSTTSASPPNRPRSGRLPQNQRHHHPEGHDRPGSRRLLLRQAAIVPHRARQESLRRVTFVPAPFDTGLQR